VPATQRQCVTGSKVKGVVTDNFKWWLLNPADGLRDRAARAKSAPGRRVYGTGKITGHWWRRDAAARVHAQAGCDQCPRVRMAGRPVNLLDRSDLHDLP
jgi:hypothetical protein